MLNSRQIKAAQTLTQTVERYTVMSDGDHINGAVCWRIEQIFRDGSAMLVGSNIENMKWYQSHTHVIALVGVRGGVKIRANEGAKYLKKG